MASQVALDSRPHLLALAYLLLARSASVTDRSGTLPPRSWCTGPIATGKPGSWCCQYAQQQSPAAMPRFFEAGLYLQTTQELAGQLAAHYHPHAKDAIENLTIPEVLTAAELAICDLRRFVDRNVPGSHLMTIRWLSRAPQVTSIWNRLRPFYYAVSVIWHPWHVLSRAAADETVVSPVMEEIKKEALTSIYRAFVLQLGKYLIELNSHRLIVGPDRWRTLMGRESHDATTAPASESAADRASLQIVVVGQVKAGKSSLVNALLGDRQAGVDALPLTATITKYTLRSDQTATPLVVLDTVGYARQGLKADRVEETMRAVCNSAMTLLVMHAHDPAREPDCQFLDSMEKWFAAHPHRRRPPILVVVTHIDALSPRLEWSPPYDGWVRPHPPRLKEQNIRAAIESIQGLLNDRVQGVVPACTDKDHEHIYGVTEWVVPALFNLLPEATAKQLVDALYDQSDRRRVTRLMSQLWNAASLLAKYHFCGPESLFPQPDPHPEHDQTD